MQSVFSDGALSLHTRSLKYGKVSYLHSHTVYRTNQPLYGYVGISFFCFSIYQLGQGVLVQLSPSLIKRQKTHFHNLPCGASIILGNNGFVWLYPTPGQQEEEAGGFYTSLEVHIKYYLLILI